MAAYLTLKAGINVPLRMFGTLVSSYVHTSCAHFLHPHFLCDHAFAHICTLVTSYLDTCQLLCTVDHTFAHICTLVTSYLDTRQLSCTVYAQYTHKRNAGRGGGVVGELCCRSILHSLHVCKANMNKTLRTFCTLAGVYVGTCDFHRFYANPRQLILVYAQYT